MLGRVGERSSTAACLGGGIVLNQNGNSAESLEGGEGSKQKYKHADTFKGRGGRVESIAEKT